VGHCEPQGIDIEVAIDNTTPIIFSLNKPYYVLILFSAWSILKTNSKTMCIFNLDVQSLA
jgi:hypothetical protein